MKRFVSLTLCVLVVLGLSACKGGGQPTSRPASPVEATKTAEPAPATTVSQDTLLEPVEGTTWELVTYVPHKRIPVEMPLKGPWIIEVTPEDSWDVSTSKMESVALKDVPEAGGFPKATYAIKFTSGASETYHLRGFRDKAVIEYGLVTKDGGAWKPVPFDKPAIAYPLDMKPGDTRVIMDDANQRIDGVAIAESTLKTAVGEFENALLVRFDFTHKREKNRKSHHYFLYAPKVGLVAQVSGASGQETGVDVTHANVVQVITSVPDALR